ncbi:MAG TPA: hypothetical protein VK522_05490 [Pseudolabrys sp.]|nr:hypothetical protein [Pseudolabrys sp.]
MAEKTLNDQIEGIFQGVVFILFSFLFSVFILLFKPRTGFNSLVRNLRIKGSNQVRPYVFCFMAIALTFFLPTTLDALAPHPPGDLEYQIRDSEHRQVGGLGRAYNQATTQIETKVATSIFVAAAAGVAVLHLCVTLLARVGLRQRARRETWRDSVFFTAGLQYVVLGISLVIFRSRPGWLGSTELGLLQDIVSSPRALAERLGKTGPYSVYFDLIGTALLIAMMLAPLAIAGRYARHAVLPGQRQVSMGSSRRIAAWAVFFLLAIDLSALASFAIAAHVSDEIQPRKKPVTPFAIKQLACTIDPEADGAKVTAEAILTIIGADAWYFQDGDFRMFVGAKRVVSDGPARSRAVINPNRIIAGPLLAPKLSTNSPRIGPPPFLLETGRSVLVNFEVKAPLTLMKFLNDHPDDQRCTVSYSGDYPVGAIGVLNLRSEQPIREYGRR